jgi:hypothetical protein
MGSNRVKWHQMMSNWVKPGQMGSSGARQGQMEVTQGKTGGWVVGKSGNKQGTEHGLS